MLCGFEELNFSSLSTLVYKIGPALGVVWVPVISAPRRLRQKDCKFETNYIGQFNSQKNRVGFVYPPSGPEQKPHILLPAIYYVNSVNHNGGFSSIQS